MPTRAQQLLDLGQSVWLDYIHRRELQSGVFAAQVRDQGVVGVTSNPTLFQQAIGQGGDYDDAIRAGLARDLAGVPLYESLAIEDVQAACDALLPVFVRSAGLDGRVSIEVSPRLAHDADGTVEEARRLKAAVARANVMIKVPATAAGLPAVRTLIAEGTSVNVTLIFSIASHAKVIDAFMSGLEDRVKRGQPIDRIGSVASFFVSRVDTAVDKLLDAKGGAALALRGKAAIANAKLAYELFEKEFGGPRFAALKQKGAQFQRPLWASTSTKNPAYKDTIYVDALIGPHTVDTLPPATLTAFNDHGTVAVTLRDDLPGAKKLLRDVEAAGISMEKVCADLLTEGVASFAKSFQDLLAAVEARRKEIPAPPKR
jgi:transaldolase